MKILICKEAHKRINDYYRNVALRYPNTNSKDEIRNNIKKVHNEINKIGTNELVITNTILSDWEGYNVCRSKEIPWYFVYLIDKDIIRIYDAEHANNMSDNTYVSKRNLPKIKK